MADTKGIAKVCIDISRLCSGKVAGMGESNEFSSLSTSNRKRRFNNSMIGINSIASLDNAVIILKTGAINIENEVRVS